MTYTKCLAHNGHAINVGLELKLWMWLGRELLYDSAVYTQQQKKKKKEEKSSQPSSWLKQVEYQ